VGFGWPIIVGDVEGSFQKQRRIESKTLRLVPYEQAEPTIFVPIWRTERGSLIGHNYRRSLTRKKTDSYLKISHIYDGILTRPESGKERRPCGNTAESAGHSCQARRRAV
jgi:hypothetical protein